MVGSLIKPPQYSITSAKLVPSGTRRFFGFLIQSPATVTTRLIRGFPSLTALKIAAQVSALKITYPTSAGSLPEGNCTPKYPQGDERQIMYALYGVQLPEGNCTP